MILVLGFYNSSNIGDMLFEEAFKSLFKYQFKFVKNLYKEDLQACDAVIIGGGSFLGSFFNISYENLEILKRKPILYIGVGIEDFVDPTHLELFKIAKLIAVRNSEFFERTKAVNSNTILIPDFVWSLKNKIKKQDNFNKSILVLPNLLTVPRYSDPHWMHVSWNYFKSEFAQFLDGLIGNGYKIDFFGMSFSSYIKDDYAAIEIINSMKNKTSNILSNKFVNITDLNFFSSYEAIVSQRFHGLILAEMFERPFLSIYHHDKLNYKSCNGENISFYGLNKHELFNKFNSLKTKENIGIKTNMVNALEVLSSTVREILGPPDDEICRH